MKPLYSVVATQQTTADHRASGCNNLDKVLADFNAIIEKRTSKRQAEAVSTSGAKSDLKRQRILGKSSVAVEHTPAPVLAPESTAGGETTTTIAGIPSIECPPAMMATGKCESIIYKGCKIYSSVKMASWRVYPYRKLSVYDKRFRWSTDPKAQWEKVLRYCEKPTLPHSRGKDIASLTQG